MDQILMFIAPIISNLSAKYPVVMMIITIIGMARLVVKPLMSIVRSVVLATPSKSDDEAVDKIEKSKVYGALIYMLDWFTSIKIEKK